MYIHYSQHFLNYYAWNFHANKMVLDGTTVTAVHMLNMVTKPQSLSNNKCKRTHEKGYSIVRTYFQICIEKNR
jgi:hypothetical protein